VLLPIGNGIHPKKLCSESQRIEIDDWLVLIHNMGSVTKPTAIKRSGRVMNEYQSIGIRAVLTFGSCFARTEVLPYEYI
jgi:hypothetical protein